MPDSAIIALHETCDCFVMPSYGEGWNLPAFDAMAMGKTPIVTACTSMSEFINPTNGYLIPSYTEPCFGMMNTIDGLYTSRQTWERISVYSLRKAMREAFENRKDVSKARNGINNAENFSYENVGKQIKDKLSCL
jgi:glycosyltransferase involved in cell wall biosynthesis